MVSKVWSRNTIWVLGFVLALSLCIGLQNAIAEDETDPCEGKAPDCIYGCPDDALFTMDFRLEDCKFKDKGENPYFILKPGYRLVLESKDEKSVETVLRDKKKIHLDGRKIETRVVEERAYEWDDEEEEWVAIEISLNYFAICKKTNAVYYFGEWSRDCPDGFDDNDECTGEENHDGSWEAGVEGARPGLIMPGTALNGARYFQEIAEEQEAVDRGEIRESGLDVEVPVGEFSGCIEIDDTNPTEDVCEPEEDVKLYCPGVGLVQDQELQLVSYGFSDDDHKDKKKHKK